MNNLRFFNYRTNFVAETKNRFLFIYFQASILEDLAFNINIKKIKDMKKENEPMTVTWDNKYIRHVSDPYNTA